MAFIERIRDILLTPHPYERDVLILLAWFRACFVTATGIAAFWFIWFSGFPLWSRLVLIALGIPVGAFLSALVSADFLEHRFKRWMLGYTYNPRVMAAGELESFTGPTLMTEHPASHALLRVWERHKYDLLYFRVSQDDTADLNIIGYDVMPWTFFRCLWEGDPASGRFGGE